MRKINIKNVVVIVVALAGLFMLNGLIVNNSKPVQASVRNAKTVKIRSYLLSKLTLAVMQFCILFHHLELIALLKLKMVVLLKSIK
ncbi:hypothetical protein [uncultured Lactobacillus sp.]|uniref:hypothetical protein n=1 Tax=uncultured Lactobacillus sp. TaxID=153152 RepID=UPI002617D1BE|nr:hypothetical protein [uncultured Lactobacillus sp.]